MRTSCGVPDAPDAGHRQPPASPQHQTQQLQALAHLLVAEGLECLLQRLVEQARVAKRVLRAWQQQGRAVAAGQDIKLAAVGAGSGSSRQ